MRVTSVDKTKEKIGNLTPAGSNINMAPSVLTIGGLQYHTEATLVATMPALSPNSRYQIYAVLNAGNVELVISQLENSSGPAGYDVWKLVGSFYSNGLEPVGFGSFVNITGVPRTDFFNAGKTFVVDPSNNENGTVSTNPVRDQWLISRDGKYLRYNWDYFATDNTGSSPGTSTFYIFWPKFLSHITIDPGYLFGTTSYGQGGTAHCFVGVDNVTYDDGQYALYGRNYGVSIVEGGQVLDSGKLQLSGFAINYSLKIRDAVAIEQWDETPIEDL